MSAGNDSAGTAGDGIIEALVALVRSRAGAGPGVSYTALLMQKGRGEVARKVGEEGVETAIAAATGDREATIRESADLLFHLAVLWVDAGIAPGEVQAELAARRGVSGLAAGKHRTGARQERDV